MAITRDLWIVLRARDEASRIIRSFGNNVAGAANTAAGNMTNFEQRMQRLATVMNQFAMTSMLAGTALAGVGAVGLNFIKDTVDVAVAYEKQVRATKTQVDDLAISLDDLAGIGRRVAKQVEIPFEQMQETLFFIFSSMNVTLAESEQLLKGFAKEAVAGQTSIENAARSNIAIMNSLGLSTKDLQRIQDVQFQVVRKGVITYEELSNVIGRALPAAARSGQSIETLGAMMAFLTRNGLSAAMASASAARALESFAHPTTVKRLEQIGIKVRDAKGEFLPLIDVMTQMNKKLAEMSQPERASFFQELFKGAGGTIQARRFWDTAFKNFGDFQEMMGFMTNSAGVFENSYENMANSVANKTVLLENKWMLIKEALGRAVIPHLLKLMDYLGMLLDWFDRLPEPTKNVIAQFILWGSIISIAVGVLITFVGVLAFFVSGIMAAGTALVYILGAIVAINAAIAAFTAAIILAWRNSEEFRATVRDIIRIFSDLWGIVVKVAGDVQKSFDDKIRPAMERLWNIIETKVLPAVRQFVQMLKEEVFPRVKEASDILVTMASKVFGYVADVINNVVIPAISKLSNWWKENGDAIRPFLALAGELVKWLLILVGAFVLAPVVAFFTAIAALILGVYNFITSLKTLWSWLVIAFNAVKDFLGQVATFIQGIGERIVKEFINAWARTVSFVNSAMNAIRDVISAALKFVYDNIWMPFWNMFGGLITETFGLITDLIRFFTVLIGEIIKDWIVPLVNYVVSMWNALVDFTSSLWQGIVSEVTHWANIAWNIVTTIFRAVRDFFVGIWNDIKDFIARRFNEVNSVIAPILQRLIDMVVNAAKAIKDGFVSGWRDLVNFVSGFIRGIIDMFHDAGVWLFNAGKNIIQGLIDGITDKIKDLRKRLKELTDLIPEIKGPKSVDLRLLFPVGRNIMTGLMDGIMSQVPMLKDQLQGLTGQLGQMQTPNMMLPTPSFAMGPSPEQKTVNQYITIHTQEINPRVNATELGWELGNRL